MVFAESNSHASDFSDKKVKVETSLVAFNRISSSQNNSNKCGDRLKESCTIISILKNS